MVIAIKLIFSFNQFIRESEDGENKENGTYTIHHILGGKKTEFAGYEMPLQYTEIQQEHEATKKGVGILDASHMGEILISGKNAFDLVQMITLNKTTQFTDGTLHYSCMPYR